MYRSHGVSLDESSVSLQIAVLPRMTIFRHHLFFQSLFVYISQTQPLLKKMKPYDLVIVECEIDVSLNFDRFAWFGIYIKRSSNGCLCFVSCHFNTNITQIYHKLLKFIRNCFAPRYPHFAESVSIYRVLLI